MTEKILQINKLETNEINESLRTVQRLFDELFSYGEMYADNITKAITVSAAKTAYEIDSNLISGLLSGITFTDSSALQVKSDGKYLINWSMSIDTGTADDELEGGVMINGSAKTKGTSHTTVETISKAQCVSGSLILDLDQNNKISLFVKNMTNTNNITVEHVSLTALKIGD
jgi:hypothetical protein